MNFLKPSLITLCLLIAGSHQIAIGQDGQVDSVKRPPIASYLALLSQSQDDRIAGLRDILRNWNDDDVGLMIEAARFVDDRRTRTAILDVLSKKTNQNFGSDLDDWYRWIWNQEVTLHPEYGEFKQQLYQRIDPRFAEYFSAGKPAIIRLDEIRWGGVHRDGIPPLDHPKKVPANEATYMNDSDVVFGVSFGGQARAYPKRILAWHEMAKDHVGGLSINGVYCTLCGSMIIYETELDGKHYELGTSGFLYRSNKLMYDHETKSMWSTLNGKPVLGPLVGKGIQLKPRYVVTTTWGQWKSDHPDTDVLSLQTGHRRDYGEGVAYNDYFSTDKLMFTVPKIDPRLKNKDEVLVVRVAGADPIAISTDFLNQNRIYQGKQADTSFVVVTDASGANRVYETKGKQFDQRADSNVIESADGIQWTVTEKELTASNKDENSLKRLPAHRAFWFGWFADHPNVKLIQ